MSLTPPTNNLADRPTVLHLAGSATSGFYHDLSLVYAREALTPASMDHCFAVVSPTGDWRLGPSLEQLSEPTGLGRCLDQLGSIDLVVPYMFDPIGMTSYRSLFEDVLRVPVVGSRAEVTALATDKSLTKLILAGAGVAVPRSHGVDDEPADLTYPVIVKPNLEDNSRGLTLVRTSNALAPAVDEATSFDAGVLIEEFVSGRELRVAVVDTGTELYVPAMIEYVVSEQHPIRELDHKLDLGRDGRPRAQSSGDHVPMICPAGVAPALRQEIAAVARRAHQALGCRDYSLFDLRLDQQGRPTILEAGLFWTFGRPSMISRMIAADERDAQAIAIEVWRHAMDRGVDRAGEEPSIDDRVEPTLVSSAGLR